MLRALVGGVLVTSATLKAVSIQDPIFQKTLVWQVFGGHHTALAALVASEALLGTAFVLGWRVKLLGGAIATMLVAFTFVALSSEAPAQTCGCLGALEIHRPRSYLALQNGLLIAAVWFAVRWRAGVWGDSTKRKS